VLKKRASDTEASAADFEAGCEGRIGLESNFASRLDRMNEKRLSKHTVDIYDPETDHPLQHNPPPALPPVPLGP
jgi:hypothetical protein